MLSYFVTDLHGYTDRYEKLFELINDEQPDAVFIGGDILPGGSANTAIDFSQEDFINNFLADGLRQLKRKLKENYPEIFIILGNDDDRAVETVMVEIATQKLWKYIHNRKIGFREFMIYGYAYVPPTPFRLKDWERYDVSRYEESGTISPEQGYYTFPVSDYDKRYATINKDIKALIQNDNLNKSIFLFHTPPYQTKLDRTDREGIKIDHAPVDIYTGSIAVKWIIEKYQPLLTLHGHIHESARLTGNWIDKIGRTYCFNSAHDGPELSLIRFDPDNLENVSRELF
jgi:Icc-related predicted phosphoesterase